jgi:hypothetical protein
VTDNGPRVPEIKVGYVTVDGRDSVAYVAEEPNAEGVHVGTGKYTDEDVAVWWSEADQCWREVTS